jgi:CheY-like chemotaxis protein
VIDDDETDCFLSKLIIENSGFVREIIIKENGKEALEYLQNECALEDQYPSLILVDLRMPSFNGFSFLEAFEKLEISKNGNIAIVVLSYSDDCDDIIKLQNLGRYNFISKPLTEDKLLDIYHRYFRNWRSLAKPKLVKKRQDGDNDTNIS